MRRTPRKEGRKESRTDLFIRAHAPCLSRLYLFISNGAAASAAMCRKIGIFQVCEKQGDHRPRNLNAIQITEQEQGGAGMADKWGINCIAVCRSWTFTVIVAALLIMDSALHLQHMATHHTRSLSFSSNSNSSGIFAAEDGKQNAEPPLCRTREAHRVFTSGFHSGEGGSPRRRRWIIEAAPCRVRGEAIEMIDDAHDFRRGYALNLTDDVEDRTHLLPWLLGARMSGRSRAGHGHGRVVLLDLGANRLRSSVAWFLRMYPLRFTEIHAFEAEPRLVRHLNRSLATWPSTWPKLQVHGVRVSHRDDAASNSVDISGVMKRRLRLRPRDTVVVKMDVEGAEWNILPRWLRDDAVRAVVDELFVEIHYSGSPFMAKFGWDAFAPRTRTDAAALLADLRWRGFYAHFWP